MSIDLDKRIIKGKKPLTAFDEIESKFIGTDCYFSDKAIDFGDLSNCQIGCLLSRNSISGTFNATKNNSYAVFNYCLPAEWVKDAEKTYRPYTLNEFVNQYSLGDEIIVRLKDKERISHKLFVEYDENDDDNMVCLGSIWYELAELYDSFEIYTGEGWKPFGVEE